MIPVTKPFLPPFEEYDAYVKDIWQRQWLTNNGPLVNELELNLKKYLDVNYMLYMSNGTVALQIAIKALDLHGEIITTPFSYVATTSSIVWESCLPVFVDIDASSLNIDPSKIEAAITPATTGILATHVFGNACNIEAIETIATKHGLKVIYDAAHCFGSRYRGKSLFEYGDISTTSFHATKLFHTIEGGAVFTSDPGILKKMSYMRNFGHASPEEFYGVGINAKNSEFHAAMGLCNLKYIPDILERRRSQSLYYNHMLRNLDVGHIQIQEGCEFNYAYYPIIFRTEEILLKAKAALEQKQIYPRRYFYPSLSNLPYVKKTETKNSDSIASRILCLPLYYQLSKEEQDMICRILLRGQSYDY